MGILVKPISYNSPGILKHVFPIGVVPQWTVMLTNEPNETISVPEYSDAELLDAMSMYEKELDMEPDIAFQLEQEEALANNRPSLYHGSGRVYLKKREWATGADDVYGYGHYQNNERAGSGNAPIIEWEHRGLYIPAGRYVKRMHIVGRCNSSAISDIQIYAGVVKPEPLTRWETGIDNDSEVSFDVLHNDMFMYPSDGDRFSGNLSDVHRRVVELDHSVSCDCMFSFYMRSASNNNSTRYFYHSWTLEIY